MQAVAVVHSLQGTFVAVVVDNRQGMRAVEAYRTSVDTAEQASSDTAWGMAQLVVVRNQQGRRGVVGK